MTRSRIAYVAILVVMSIPASALAGGWAMASFDDVPTEFQAGSTYDLEYTILQHGRTPVDVGTSQVRIIASDGTVTAIDAVALEETGRYAVSITFPESGSWQWEVTQGDFAAQEMGKIEVSAAATGAAAGSVLRWLLPLALALVIGLGIVQGRDLARVGRLGRPVRAD